MLIIKVTTGFFFFSFRIFTATIEIVQKLRMEYMPKKNLVRCTNNMIQRVVYKHFTNGLLTCMKSSLNIQHILKSICIPGLKGLTPHHVPSTTESMIDLKVCALQISNKLLKTLGNLIHEFGIFESNLPSLVLFE